MGHDLARHVARLAAMVLALAIVSSACAVPPQEQSILQCGVGALPNPFKAGPGLERAEKIYGGLEKGMTIGAVAQSVYGKDIFHLSNADADELALIISGLDDCANVSPQLHQALTGALDILRSLSSGPSSNSSPQQGPVLCPGISPFGNAPYKYRPNCGDGMEGTWALARTLTGCDNLSEGCSASPLSIQVDSCSDTQCSISRADHTWRSSHVLTRQSAGTYSADFTDVGVKCEGQYNDAHFVWSVNITSNENVDGVNRAASLGGSYSYSASTNPPSCDDNPMASFDFTANRA